MPEKTVAIDCEMVNVGINVRDDALARVSIVDEGGKCLYDKYVKPKKKITDYRTNLTGITEHHIQNFAEDFDDVREEVATILKDCILVGHSVDCDLAVLELYHPSSKIRDTAEYLPFWKNFAEDFDDVREEVATILKDCILVGHSVDCDLAVLELYHPSSKIRDTAEYLPFWKYNRHRRPSLKLLARKILGMVIQNGIHDSIEDARTAMRLYLKYKHQWTKK